MLVEERAVYEPNPPMFRYTLGDLLSLFPRHAVTDASGRKLLPAEVAALEGYFANAWSAPWVDARQRVALQQPGRTGMQAFVYLVPPET